MTAYYNEHDAHAANWLGNLADAGLLPAGRIDCRDIQEVTPDDIRGFRESHFFAGVGGWPLALRLAGWDPTRPVWTGSCPCQPFSGAGKKKGKADPRNLWPCFRDLIAECRPATIFGEQVASDLGVEWLAGVRSDLEAMGYAVGAADLCAAGVGEEAEGRIVRGHQAAWERIRLGAPHIRQRLFWVADAQRPERWPDLRRGLHGADREDAGRQETERPPARSSADARGVGDTFGPGPQGLWSGPRSESGSRRDGEPACPPGAWSNFDIIHCRDSKARRVESGSFPLAHGIPGRVGRLRGYGNAIVPQVAAVFIRAFMETTPCN